jgi:hypothetical protein
MKNTKIYTYFKTRFFSSSSYYSVEERPKVKNTRRPITVVVIDLTSNKSYEFKSINQAAKSFSVNPKTI